MLERCEGIVRTLCSGWEVEVLKFSGASDHVHVELDVPPDVRPSELVNMLKTVSSRRLRSEFALLRRSEVLWSRSYCVVSGEGAPEATVREYVEGT
jgi:putative transposase